MDAFPGLVVLAQLGWLPAGSVTEVAAAAPACCCYTCLLFLNIRAAAAVLQ
jgi:hypothetical protein